MSKPPDHQRNNSDSEVAKALQKDTRRLLSDIHLEISKWDDNKSQSRIQFAFASLLSVLADESEKITKKNLELQTKVVKLTWALFWLTLVLTFVAAIQIYFIFSDGH